jgi:hypothetical protein
MLISSNATRTPRAASVMPLAQRKAGTTRFAIHSRRSASRSAIRSVTDPTTRTASTSRLITPAALIGPKGALPRASFGGGGRSPGKRDRHGRLTLAGSDGDGVAKRGNGGCIGLPALTRCSNGGLQGADKTGNSRAGRFQPLQRDRLPAGDVVHPWWVYVTTG